MINFRKGSLYRQTFFQVMFVMAIFMLVSLAVGISFGIYPILKQSVNELSIRIVRHHQLWQQSTSDKRRELDKQHLKFVLSDRPVEGYPVYLPFIKLLEQQLKLKLKQPIKIVAKQTPETWYWFTLPQDTQYLHIGFPRTLIGTRPFLIMVTIMVLGVILSIGFSLFIASRIHRSIRPLLTASQQLSQGYQPSPVTATGPLEIQQLTASFNQMANDVRQLLDNRTTLLVGVSHNLRSPIARMRVALELLPETVDDKLRQHFIRGLDEMNSTISQFLTLAETAVNDEVLAHDIMSVVRSAVENLDHHNASIQVSDQRMHKELSKPVAENALKQALGNLLENALRYSNNSPVEIQLHDDNNRMEIQVLDNGPGIDPNIQDKMFLPFTSLNVHRSSNIPGGTGLGLAIVKLICDRHQWQINLYNRPEGGTCACLIIEHSPQ